MNGNSLEGRISVSDAELNLQCFLYTISNLCRGDTIILKDIEDIIMRLCCFKMYNYYNIHKQSNVYAANTAGEQNWQVYMDLVPADKVYCPFSVSVWYKKATQIVPTLRLPAGVEDLQVKRLSTRLLDNCHILPGPLIGSR